MEWTVEWEWGDDEEIVGGEFDSFDHAEQSVSTNHKPYMKGRGWRSGQGVEHV